jgi:hypothetical protein
MTPSDFTQALAAVNDRIRSLVTAAASLIALALLAVAASYGVHELSPGLARTIAVLALLGGGGLAVGGWLASMQRRTLYEDIIVSGFRHVYPKEVAKRATELVGVTSRLRLAGALDRFLEAARMERVAPVPVNREAMLACAAQAQAIAATLRSLAVDVEPAGMVLLQRLVTDGVTSPLFNPGRPARDLERAFDHITSTLGSNVVQFRPHDGGQDEMPLAA